MLGNAIIAIIVFGAFLRAGREYGKNGAIWGVIGVLAFFVPHFVVPILTGLILAVAGAGDSVIVGSVSLSVLLGFGVGVVTVIWTYNKLMERAIDQQASHDALVSSARAAADAGSTSH